MLSFVAQMWCRWITRSCKSVLAMSSAQKRGLSHYQQGICYGWPSIILSKMVNVASQIPFNLHNQVLPESQQSMSRSASRSIDGQYDRRYYANATYSEFYSIRDADHQRQRDDYGTLGNIYGRRTTGRSLSPSNLRAAESSVFQSRSDIAEQSKPTPILNVRLVGYTDTQYRGRTRQRSLVPTGLPSSAHNKDQLVDESSMATPTRANFPESGTVTSSEQIPVCICSKPISESQT